MILGRFASLDVGNKGLLSVIYGNIDDMFIGNDLRAYGFYEYLYLYLKSLSFDTVIFHDQIYNFYSFSEEDLAKYTLLEIAPKQDNNSMPFDTPFKGALRRKQQAKAPNNTFEKLPENDRPWNLVEAGPRQFFSLKGKGQEFAYLQKALQDSSKKTAIVFRVASHNAQSNGKVSFFDDNFTKTLITRLEEDYISKGLQSKVIFTFGSIEDEASLVKVIPDSLTDFFTVTESGQENIKLKAEKSFFVGIPRSDEVLNMLQRKRLIENINIFQNQIPLEKIVLSLQQKGNKIGHLNKINLLEYIESINSKSAWDRLRELKGLENVAKKIETIVAQLKANKNRENKASIRPHLCFKGNPGTGKTTVASIVAEIFKEEGILGIGHLVDAKVTDLVGEYVGSTRPKTERLFNKAKGGILFIDEAYGLLKNNDGNGSNFEAEAIEIMIQKMEDKSWREESLVILAGYQGQIDELLKKGNPGFTRRFAPQNHILFEDYPPSVLFDILIFNLHKLGFDSYEDGLRDTLRKIVDRLYVTRPANWGNAGEMENFASEIEACYIESGDSGELKPAHIPIEKRKLVNSGVSNKGALLELDKLIGLKNVKSTIRKIFNQLKADQLRAARGGNSDQLYRMNFVFRGNPGTGKTTVARIIGALLSELGMLSDGTCLEKGRSDIVAGFLGQTALKVNEVFKESVGKALFIDEVYSLVNGETDSFGLEAVNEIVRHLTLPEFDGKMAFLIAGYPDDVERFLNYNDGLKRRFNYYIDFENYSNEELLEIYKLKIKKFGLILHPDGDKYGLDYFDQFPRNKGFENAGLADRLVGVTKSNLDDRISLQLENGIEVMDVELNHILPSDFPNYTEIGI
jgi:SpoVK/Ycf46/Vps4 family AAA+-type ATPase